MNEGLFKYCRHPNYFGEMLVWTSLTLLAGTGGVLKMHPWIVTSPLFTIFLLCFVSGGHTDVATVPSFCHGLP